MYKKIFFTILFLLAILPNYYTIFAQEVPPTYLDQTVTIAAQNQALETTHYLNSITGVILGFDRIVKATAQYINNEMSVPDFENQIKFFQKLYDEDHGGGKLMPELLKENFHYVPRDEENSVRHEVVLENCNESNLPNTSGQNDVLNLPIIKGVSDDEQTKDAAALFNIAGNTLGVGPGTTLNYKSLAQTFSKGTNGQAYFLPEFKNILLGCKANSDGLVVPDRPYEVTGVMGGEETNTVIAPVDTIKTLINDVLLACLNPKNLGRCSQVPRLLTHNATVETLFKLGTTIYANTRGIDLSEMPESVANKEEFVKNRGWSTPPQLVREIVEGTDNSYVTKSHAKLRRGAQTDVEVSGDGGTTSDTASYTVQGNMAAPFQHFAMKECMLTPDILQEANDMRCKPVENGMSSSTNGFGSGEVGTGITGNWSKGDPVHTPGNPVGSCNKTPTLGSKGNGVSYPLDPKNSGLNNDYMLKIIKDAAKDKIPACMLVAISMIEGGMHWTESDNVDWDRNNPQNPICLPNMWGAAGPFQITINHDTCGGSCDSTLGGTCPNTWNNRPGSPCRAEDAAPAAVEILQQKAKYGQTSGCPFSYSGDLNGGSWQAQQSAIYKSACHYYGANDTHARLGGRTYAEFVVEFCKYHPTGS